MVQRTAWWVLGAAWAASACDAEPPAAADGSTPTVDAAPMDAQRPDRGAPDMRARDAVVDAAPAVDGGAPPQDAAPPPDLIPAPDSDPPVDAAAPDAGPALDAAPELDQAAPECAPGQAQPCGDCQGSQQRCLDGQWGPCQAPPERCNGADDDCDGQTDEGLPLEAYFVDPDQDGFFGAVPADRQPSCAAWLATGRTDDGVYPIDPDGDGPAPALDVYCDMSTDGGGWTRVFFHDVAGGYWAELDPLAHAPEDPRALRYSILGWLDAFRSSDGLLDLRISWPDSGIPGRNLWRQGSDPTEEAIAGYVPVALDYEDNGWGGLERNRFNNASFIDGTVGVPNWFYAVASTGPWGEPAGIPAHGPSSPRVAVWVRPDDAPLLVQPERVMACGPLPGLAAEGGDCQPDEPAARPGGAEVCDAVDNDCDGVVDEGFEIVTWYPDRDGDGFGASAGSSCASLQAAGVVEDGVYAIRPGGADGPALDVFCDMTTDGGGWTRVLHHEVAGGYFRSDADAAERSVGDPLAPLYSVLVHLEHFRSSDGRFELRLSWPDLEGRNLWRQASNPTVGPVDGYEAIDVDHTEQFWGGLEPAGRAQTWLNGSVGHPNWFYAVGAQTPWRPSGDVPEGVPAYGPRADGVSLWVRPDDERVGGAPIDACEAPEGYVQAAGDCDDLDDAKHPEAVERCDGLDNDCDGGVDEGCPPGGVALAEAPSPLHFYGRDRETGRCLVRFAGTLEGAAAAVRVIPDRDGVPQEAVISEAADFELTFEVDAGLVRYGFAVAWTDADGLFWRPVAGAQDVLCGDVFLIDGQSNAVATDYHRENLSAAERSPFVRSFGSGVADASVVEDTRFGVAVPYPANSHASIGQWGLRVANRIKDAEQVPVLVINGAVGGTRVAQHQRDDADPENLATIYGRLLWRVRAAGLAERVRGIMWHQGESDGGLAYDTYLARWTAMYTDWLEDYPNVEGVFVFQVRAGCGNPTWNRNVARELPGLLDRVLGNMSTTGVDGHDDCHFFHRTYAEWGDRMARVVRRALYGARFEGNIDAPNPQSARWRDRTTLAIEYGDTGGGLVLQAGAAAYFSLSDGAAIVDARVDGTAVVLTTAAPSAAEWVSFVDVRGDIPWLVNDLGIGGFAFYEFPIERR